MRFQSCSFKCDVKRKENSLLLELVNSHVLLLKNPSPVRLGSLLSCGRACGPVCPGCSSLGAVWGQECLMASPQWRLCVAWGIFLETACPLYGTAGC